MRFPIAAGHDRAGSCPRCEAPAEDLGAYPPAFDHPADGRDRVRLAAVLDNVRSALNVGTMLRAADGARVEHLQLTGLTPAADHPKVAKTSLGAEATVAWSQHLDATVGVEALLATDWQVWALESTPTSEPLAEVLGAAVRAGELSAKLAIVVGNELAGVDPVLLTMAHRHVHLPMGGAKTTLNVGVAFGAAIYAIRTAEALLAGA